MTDSAASATVVEAPADTVRVVVRLHPFREAKTIVTVPAGRTITELLTLAGLPPESAGVVRVEGVRVPREKWSATQPAAGELVTSYCVPHGSRTAKSITGAVIMIIGAVLIATGIGAPFGVPLIVTGAGMIASANLGPQAAQFNPGPAGPARALRPFISGTRNELRPYGVVPQVFGYRVRYRPPYAAKPYSSWQGNRQRWHCLMTFGHGPLRLENHKFGDTPVAALGLKVLSHGVNRTDEQIQVREGRGDDNELQFYLDQVTEEPLQVDLQRDNSDGSRSAWSFRRTEPNVARVGVEVYFPQGLIDYSGSKPAQLEVEIEVFYAPAGTAIPADADLAKAGWIAAVGKDEKNQKNKFPGIKVKDSRRSPFAVGIDWDPTGGAGQFDVALRRKTADRNEIAKLDTSTWSILRTWRLSSPINLTGLCTVSFDIVATGNLSGSLDAYNAEATWMGPYYDTGSSSWVTPARNDAQFIEHSAQPAAHYRAILQGSANRSPVADARIDLAQLAAWAAATEAAGLYFNGVMETPGTVFDRLNEVAAMGRASPHMRDGKFSVVTDISAPGAALEKFTPREYSNFQGEFPFLEAVHALNVEYVNQAIEGLDRIVVYDDGYNVDGSGGKTVATKFDALTLINCRDKDLAWRHGRRALAERRLRRERYGFDVTDAHLSVTRGDCVELGIESIDTVLAWGRVKAVVLNGAGDAVSFTSDEVMSHDGASSYLFRFRKASGVTLDRSIGTPAAGDATSFTFTTPIPAANPQPVAGDLFLFGKATTDFRRCLIQQVEHRANFVARVTCVDEAPGVYTADTSTPSTATQSASTAPAASASGSEAVLQVVASQPASTANGSAGIVVTVQATNRNGRR